MPRKKTERFTVRGIMKRGRVEIFDQVDIPNGTLLDIVVIETVEEKSFKTARKKRKAGPEKPLRFTFVGKKQLTADPIVFLKRMAKSTVSNVRFDGYKATCHVIPCDLQCAVAEYMINLFPPPAKIAKLLRKAIRQRTRFEFNANTRKGNKFIGELRELVDLAEGDIDTGCNLWFAAIHLIVGGVDTVPNALVELNEFGPLVAREKIEQKKRLGPTQGKKIEDAARQEIDTEIRKIVFDQLKRAAVRSRKKNSSPSESAKMERKELSEIAKRLEKEKSVRPTSALSNEEGT